LPLDSWRLLDANRAGCARFIEKLKEGLPWPDALRQVYGGTPEQVALYGRRVGVPDSRP
jgi:hypothetical protein